MANLKLKNPSGGSLNFVSADGASDLTVTFPATTGTAMVSGNMPAASVYMANTMNGVSSDVFTKVQFDTKVFDTATCFNNTGSTVTLNGLSVPSYSFCPNVAGYYQVTMNMDYFGTTSGLNITQQIYKNGARHTQNYFYSSVLNSGGYEFPQTLGALVYLNGTGDYLNGYLQFNNGSSIQIYGGQPGTRFDAICVRTA